MCLNDLAGECHTIAAGHGFWKERVRMDTAGLGAFVVPSCLALIHSEVSEALEAHRNRDRAGLEEELADIIIRTLDLAAWLRIDIDEVVRTKIEYNRTRPIMHGGKQY